MPSNSYVLNTVLLQTIQFTSLANSSVGHKYVVSLSKSVLFQAIQFIIITHFRSFLPIDKTLPGTTTLSQSGRGSDGNEGVHHIPQITSIIGISSSDCLLSYRGLA